MPSIAQMIAQIAFPFSSAQFLPDLRSHVHLPAEPRFLIFGVLREGLVQRGLHGAGNGRFVLSDPFDANQNIVGIPKLLDLTPAQIHGLALHIHLAQGIPHFPYGDCRVEVHLQHGPALEVYAQIRAPVDAEREQAQRDDARRTEKRPSAYVHEPYSQILEHALPDAQIPDAPSVGDKIEDPARHNQRGEHAGENPDGQRQRKSPDRAGPELIQHERGDQGRHVGV